MVRRRSKEIEAHQIGSHTINFRYDNLLPTSLFSVIPDSLFCHARLDRASSVFGFSFVGEDTGRHPATTLRYASFGFAPLRSLRLRFATLPSTSLRYASFDFASLRFLRLRFATLPSTSLRYAPFDFASLRFLRLRFATLPSTSLRYAQDRLWSSPTGSWCPPCFSCSS